MDGNENDYKIFFLQRQQQNTRVVICLFWMHSHVNTCYLWCEIKNIFPLDRNTIWSCILLDFEEMYHDFPSSKMFEILWKLWNWESGRPALIINRIQCWLNNSDTRTPRKELEAKKIVILYIIFFHKSTPAKPNLVLMGNKLIFVWNGPKVSRWAKKGPILSKSSRFTI